MTDPVLHATELARKHQLILACAEAIEAYSRLEQR